MRLREIAEHLGAELHGDGEKDIVGVNRVQDANEHELTFLANPKYRKYLPGTKAGAVVVSQPEETCPAAQLIALDPLYAFARALRLFYPEPGSHLTTGVHRTALIDPSAKVAENVHLGRFVSVDAGSVIGKGSRIADGVVISRNCRIGSECLIHPNVTIYDDSVLGDRVTIHAGTVIGSDGFGYAPHDGTHYKIYQIGSVRIEDDVEIGANCTIDRAAMGETIIGAGSKIDNLVQIAHNVRTGRGCVIVSQVGISGSTVLGDYVTLAGQVGLVGHIEIGDGAVVAAQAGVPKSIPAGKIFAGSPAREFSEFKRTEAHIRHLSRKMKLLLNLEEEVANLRRKLEELERKSEK